jgi:hypothetical protein
MRCFSEIELTIGTNACQIKSQSEFFQKMKNSICARVRVGAGVNPRGAVLARKNQHKRGFISGIFSAGRLRIGHECVRSAWEDTLPECPGAGMKPFAVWTTRPGAPGSAAIDVARRAQAPEKRPSKPLSTGGLPLIMG